MKKIFKFIKGLVNNLQKTGIRTLVQWYGFIQAILKAGVNVGMSNIDMRNNPSEWAYIEIVFFLAL